jgi:hypothetical protein
MGNSRRGNRIGYSKRVDFKGERADFDARIRGGKDINILLREYGSQCSIFIFAVD